MAPCNPNKNTEVLAEAVSNEVETMLETGAPYGFGAKYAAEAQSIEIEPALAINMTYLMTNKLTEKVMSEILDKYDTPKNYQSILVPEVKALIWDGMMMSTTNVHLKIQKMQKALVKGIIAITQDLKQ